MPNTPSAKKRLRQTIKRTEVNRSRISRVRTFIRKVEEAIAAGDKDGARAALRAAEPELMRGANKRVVHKNTASRKISRLSQRIKGMEAKATA